MVTGVPFPSDGLAHHYAVTAGADTRLYVDGSLIATFGPITLTGAGGTDTRLGRQFDPFAEFFDGNIDELWVFQGALTAGEVANLAVVPEPSSLAMFALGSVLLGGTLFRRATRRHEAKAAF
jgi:hypothetical protein